MNFGAHEFGDIITVQTGDDAKSARQVKTCYICGYEVFSSLKMKDAVGLTPAVAVGDETSVKNSLLELLTKIEAQLGVPMFDYDEFVPDAGGYSYLTDEDIAVNAVSYDFSDVDLSAPGYKTIIVSYNGTKCYFEILLTPDLSSVAKTEYKSEDWRNSTADLYANGYLALNYDTGLSFVLKCDMLDEANGIMTLYRTENTKQLIILDDENKTVNRYTIG